MTSLIPSVTGEQGFLLFLIRSDIDKVTMYAVINPKIVSDLKMMKTACLLMSLSKTGVPDWKPILQI